MTDISNLTENHRRNNVYSCYFVFVTEASISTSVAGALVVSHEKEKKPDTKRFLTLVNSERFGVRKYFYGMFRLV